MHPRKYVRYLEGGDKRYAKVGSKGYKVFPVHCQSIDQKLYIVTKQNKQSNERLREKEQNLLYIKATKK